MQLIVENTVRDSLDILESHQREIPMLEHMEKMMPPQSQRRALDPREKAKREEVRVKKALEDYAARPGLSLTHIGPDGICRKEKFKAQVFRPGHNLPTMTLEEFADMEVAEAIERKKRQDAAEKSRDRPRKMKELIEAGEEDDEELVDKATKRDRDWDNWKDMNPKGVGVTKRF